METLSKEKQEIQERLEAGHEEPGLTKRTQHAQHS